MKDFKHHGEVLDALKSNKLTCVEWFNIHVQKIKEQEDLNVFLEIFENSGLKQAEKIDLEISQGVIKPLSGMIVGIKDLFCYKNHIVSAGSKILENFESQYSATCVERLVENGAIIIGRQNCDEFAMGSSNENSAYGPTKNGLDKTRVPGGSSGASAVAVQQKFCQISLGTDTGGSVRQPASYCGVIGIKPTYSRISRYGVVAYASSFDVIGILSNNIYDNALVLEIIAGNDNKDSTCSKKNVDPYTEGLLPFSPPQKKKLAYLDGMVDYKGFDKVVKNLFFEQIEVLKKQGHSVKKISFEYLEYLLPIYYILTTAEASSNLARYDGVRYGYRSSIAENLEDLYIKTRTEGFGPEVRKRILLGAHMLGAEYYDAYYLKAQKARQLVKKTLDETLDQFDFIISPTTMGVAFPLAFKNHDPIAMYFEDLFTVCASIAGVPAITVPYSKKVNNLPIGIQAIGSYFKEKELYQFANILGKLN